MAVPGSGPCTNGENPRCFPGIHEMGADRAWWLDWSSKPACPARTRVGGFDSHTLPPSDRHPAGPHKPRRVSILPRASCFARQRKQLSQNGPFRVILNPAASGGRGAKLLAPLQDGLGVRGIDHTLDVTEGPGHARELARQAISEGDHRILVVGGDGTIHEVANGILEEEDPTISLSVLPVGTGNDFFRMLGSSKRPDSALDTLQRGEVRRFEVGSVRFDDGSCHFVNLLGVGLDVEVLRRRSEFRRLNGLPQYLAALAATVVSFQPCPLRVDFVEEGRTVEGPVMLALLTVGPSIGGGFLISPEASPYDGFLDFCAVDPLSLWKVARYVPRVIRGTHQGIPEFHFGRTRHLRFRRPDGQPFFFELDGELMPEQTTFLEVRVRAEALPVVTPVREDAP